MMVPDSYDSVLPTFLSFLLDPNILDRLYIVFWAERSRTRPPGFPPPWPYFVILVSPYGALSFAPPLSSAPSSCLSYRERYVRLTLPSPLFFERFDAFLLFLLCPPHVFFEIGRFFFPSWPTPVHLPLPRVVSRLRSANLPVSCLFPYGWLCSVTGSRAAGSCPLAYIRYAPLVLLHPPLDLARPDDSRVFVTTPNCICSVILARYLRRRAGGSIILDLFPRGKSAIFQIEVRQSQALRPFIVIDLRLPSWERVLGTPSSPGTSSLFPTFFCRPSVRVYARSPPHHLAVWSCGSGWRVGFLVRLQLKLDLDGFPPPALDAVSGGAPRRTLYNVFRSSSWPRIYPLSLPFSPLACRTSNFYAQPV